MTLSAISFEPFPKISRLFRTCTITEKIDGTNAQVIVTESGEVAAASRNRLLTPQDDNFGFAAWVEENKDELRKLGPGRHFGEWWGQGIQRGYGQTEKHFSLFNTGRWGMSDDLPKCCSCVPELYVGVFSQREVDLTLETLRRHGSFTGNCFPNPEGIVIYHHASRQLFKVTLDNDAVPKGMAA